MRKRSHALRIMTMLITAILVVQSFGMLVYANDTTLQIDGKYIEFNGKDNYSIDENTDGVKTSVSNTLGNFSISGNTTDKGNGVYYIQSGNVNISYRVNINRLQTDATQWHLTDDKSKSVNGFLLDDKILMGAIIVQSSLDGKDWITDKVITDAFSEKATLPNVIFTTKDIQQLNGCHYRVLVVYKLEKRVEDSKVLFWDKANYEYKRAAEVYSFFVINQHTIDTGAASPADKPRKEFSTVVNTGKDNGYDLSQAEDMDKDDPHFHKTIGYFTVNGYTRETADKDGKPVFLKTVGDEVTLWFTLTQNINQLFGNSNLSISEDINGYDKAMFGGDQTNFKHGALFVKFTDEEGHSREDVTYIDFLKANATTGADTRIQLYEEGDYEIALDYEIRDRSPLIDSYKNYKIYFKFSIRNGNTMAFPRDAKTGSELKDGEWTANGFTIDLAESKYLTIDLVRREVVQKTDGTISTGVRANKVGKVGTVYNKNGIYEITVKNQYSDGKPTTVTLYVGNDKNIIALAQNRMSVDRFNELIRSGYTVEDDGTIAGLPKPTEPVTTPTTTSEVPEKTQPLHTEKPINVEKTQPSEPSKPSESELNNNTTDDQKSAPIFLLAVGALIVVGGLLFWFMKKRSRREKQ